MTWYLWTLLFFVCYVCLTVIRQSIFIRYAIIQYGLFNFGISEVRRYKFFNREFTKECETQEIYIGGDDFAPKQPIRGSTKEEMQQLIDSWSAASKIKAYVEKNFPREVT